MGGVTLSSHGRTVEFVVSGYADDTAVYLRKRSAVKQVVDILEGFGSVSGLLTNRAKSIVIELDRRGANLPLDTQGLSLIAPSNSCRYLSVLVGQRDNASED